ncbi:HAD family hydrolase [Daejeonella sp.]|jgi:phosphoglycolate phosphatase|uniref:HAD family hydrolase n=1 Tax=Daejeonella sp. TaxID=2805397 RepID=UPI0037C14D9E
MNKPDSLIFDLDGTLWDALDTYLESWNLGAQAENLTRTFTRDDLHYVMGWERSNVLDHMFPGTSKLRQEEIYKTINEFRLKIMPQMGGVLYEGVREGLIKLSEKYQLFIVSNCPANLIVEFMKWADLEQYITDEMAHGVNSMPKHHNIKLLVEKHQLKKPIYIGDTHGDSIETRKADLPFVLVTYGFGTSDDYDLKFDNFNDFTNYFMNL